MTIPAYGAETWAGFVAQSAWNTETSSGHDFLPCRPGGMKLVQKPTFSTQARGFTKRHGRKTNESVEGTIPFDFYFVGLEKILDEMFSRTSTEVASYVVTSANDVIDFKEDAGGTLNADVADGSYTTTTYGAALKTALEAAGVGTYTITYSTSTKKFSVAVAGAASAVQFLGTGDGEALIGFAVASASAASITSDTAVASVYDHVYTPLDTGQHPNVYGLTLWDHKDLKTWECLSAFVTALTIGFEENAQFVTFSPTFVAASRTRATSNTPTFGTAVPANPAGNLTITVTATAGALTMEATAFTVSITLPTTLKHSITSLTAKHASRGDRMVIEGSAAWEYTNEAIIDGWLDDWESGTAVNISAVLTGSTLRGAIAESLTIGMPESFIGGDDPVSGGAGAMELPFLWEAAYDYGNSAAALTLTLRNDTYLA